MKETRLQENVGIIAVPKSVRAASQQEYARFVQPIGEALSGEIATQVEKIIATEYSDYPWFQKDVCYRQGNRGSSVELNVLRNSALREFGLSLPGLLEGKYLDAQGVLSNSVYREYGLQIASEGDLNADLSNPLIAEAKKRSWKLPLVIHSYTPLGHKKGDAGFEIYFLGDNEGIDLEKEVLHGDEAREFLLSNFKKEWIGEKGVRRLCRFGGGVWDANWYDRVSNSNGRVDFISGEASAKNITSIKERELAREYGVKAQEYDDKIAKLTIERDQLTMQHASALEAFIKALKS